MRFPDGVGLPIASCVPIEVFLSAHIISRFCNLSLADTASLVCFYHAISEHKAKCIVYAVKNSK